MFEGKSLRQASEQKTGLYHHKSNTSMAEMPEKLFDRTLGCRYEMKYLISESKAEAIAQFIKPYLHLDRYCKLQRSGDYPVASLYFDSDDLQLCGESLRGHKNRVKLRIRSYTDETDYPRFVEIKRRMNSVIIKGRARIMDRDVQTLLAGLTLPPQNYTVDMETINQFQLYLNSIKAKPVVLTRYIRRAYEGDSENRVRVTFDRQLAYNITSLPKVRHGGGGWQRHPYTLAGVILEIKFTDRYPLWLSQMVKYFDLRQRSISKYATSIKDSCLLKFCAPQLAG